MQSNLKSFFYRLNRRDIPLFPKKINKYAKIFIVVFLVLAVFSTKKILAIRTAVDLLSSDKEAVEQDNNLESWSMKLATTNIVHLFNFTTGGITIATSDTGTSKVSYVPGGAIGSLNNIISPLYDMPISGTQYIARAKDEFLGATYATGFQELQPLIPIWKTIRNIIYILASIVFVIIGIMLMLRIKINPQTVITIQNSIPKLITSLILVTFSYAIAGLVIDISRVFLALSLSVFFTAKHVGISENLLVPDPELHAVDIVSPLNLLQTAGDAISLFVNNTKAEFGIQTSSLEQLSNMGFNQIFSYVMRAIPGTTSFALGEVSRWRCH
jgi:hypothetical protein